MRIFLFAAAFLAAPAASNAFAPAGRVPGLLRSAESFAPRGFMFAEVPPEDAGIGIAAAGPGASSARWAVSLAPLRDRHVRQGGVETRAGRVALTLRPAADGGNDGYLAVLPAGESEIRYFKIQAGLRGEWRAGGRGYAAVLYVTLDGLTKNRFLHEIGVEDSEGRSVWRGTIQAIMDATFAAGREVSLGSRSLRVFYSEVPAPAICVTEKTADGGYDSKLVGLSSIPRAPQAPASFPLPFQGSAGLRLSDDGSGGPLLEFF